MHKGETKMVRNVVKVKPKPPRVTPLPSLPPIPWCASSCTSCSSSRISQRYEPPPPTLHALVPNSSRSVPRPPFQLCKPLTVFVPSLHLTAFTMFTATQSAPHSAHFIITPLKPTPSDEARQMCHENYKTPSGIVFTVPGPQPQEVGVRGYVWGGEGGGGQNEAAWRGEGRAQCRARTRGSMWCVCVPYSSVRVLTAHPHIPPSTTTPYRSPSPPPPSPLTPPTPLHPLPRTTGRVLDRRGQHSGLFYGLILL